MAELGPGEAKLVFRSPYDCVRLLSRFLNSVSSHRESERHERVHIEEKENKLLEAEQNTQLTTRDCIRASREGGRERERQSILAVQCLVQETWDPETRATI